MNGSHGSLLVTFETPMSSTVTAIVEFHAEAGEFGTRHWALEVARICDTAPSFAAACGFAIKERAAVVLARDTFINEINCPECMTQLAAHKLLKLDADGKFECFMCDGRGRLGYANGLWDTCHICGGSGRTDAAGVGG